MMEPDVRIKTNEQGFCKTHYDMMFTRKNRLGMALMLESHLAEIKKEVTGGGFSLKGVGTGPDRSGSKSSRTPATYAGASSSRLSKMFETAVLLWERRSGVPRETAQGAVYMPPALQNVCRVRETRTAEEALRRLLQGGLRRRE